MLQAHNRLVCSLVGERGGDVVKSQGDGFMLAFRSAGAALTCAAELQRAVTQSNEARLERALRASTPLHVAPARSWSSDQEPDFSAAASSVRERTPSLA